MLFPQGIFTLLGSLFLGLFLGLLLAVSTLYYIFYRLTHVEPPLSVPNLPLHAPLPAAPNATADGNSGTSTPFFRRDVTRPTTTMPHAYTSHGELHGVIFTVTESYWDRNDCVLDWPPAGAGFTAWHASVSQGTLVLTPLPRHHHRHQQGEQGKDKKRKKQQTEDREEEEKKNDKFSEVVETAATATDAVQFAIGNEPHGIPLEGCTIELVQDGLQGRSEMVRKAPLLLSHSSWPLLNGEKKIFIFATDSAAKQEWIHALSYWCVNINAEDSWEGSLKSIEETYQLYCSVMAQKSTLPFVQEKFDSSSLNSRKGGAMVPEAGVASRGGAGICSGAAANDSRRSIDHHQQQQADRENAKLGKRTSWSRWRKNRQEQGGEQEIEEEGEGVLEENNTGDSRSDHALTRAEKNSSLSGSASAVTAATAPDLDFQVCPPVAVEQVAPTASDIDSIIEMRWMQSRKVPVPSPPPKQQRIGGGGGVNAGGSTISNGATPATSLASSPSLSPVKVPPIGPVVYRKVLPSMQQQLLQQQQSEGAAAATGLPRLSSLPGSAQTSPTKIQQRVQKTVNPVSPCTDANVTANASQQQQPHQQTTSPRRHPAQTSASSSRLPPGFPSPLLPFDFFINAASTRACFDLFRNPAFSEHVRARVQRQLSRMHTPEYVTSLEVVSVEPGCTAPTLSKFASVPQPDSHATFPQLVFDMKYSGSFTVTIECKVDIRDAAAWSTLDQAIDRIGGKRKKENYSGGKINSVPIGENEEADLAGIGVNIDDENEFLEEEEDIYGEEGLLHFSSSSSDEAGPLARSPKSGGPSRSQHQQQQHKQPQKRHLLGQIREKTAQKLRKLANSTATRISNLPLRVSLTFSVLEGTMCVWIPPPPGDRLFWSFLSPPKLSLKATPQIGQRLIKYAYHASRASAWIQARLELAFRKNLVFPCGGEIALPLLLPIWNPRAYDGLNGLEKEREQASSRNNTGKAQRRERDSKRPPVKVTRYEDRLQPRENGVVTASRVSAENAASTSNAAPFVEFSLRRPRTQ